MPCVARLSVVGADRAGLEASPYPGLWPISQVVGATKGLTAGSDVWLREDRGAFWEEAGTSMSIVHSAG